MDLKSAMDVVAEQATMKERARCARVCREVAAEYAPHYVSEAATTEECAEAIERGEP